MQRDDRLARSRRPRDSGRAGLVALDPLPLLGVQEDRPLLPRIIERSRQLFQIAHYAEPALGVGMFERVVDGRERLGYPRFAANSKFQQRLGGLARQMSGEVEDGILGGGSHIAKPL